jgi:hypothetical protein
MIARPKISRNEWKMAERGTFEVGNFALLSCPGYTIVVMGGIAAEAMCYGDSQGGKDDEGALIQFLQETVGGFLGSDDPAGEVANQARWAALNGLLLLRDHRAEFDRLVAALEATRARSIGTVMLAIEDGATPLEALAA